ncbi:MAG: Uma2 family endonuclease [Elainellaceae cyanobacterium]
MVQNPADSAASDPCAPRPAWETLPTMYDLPSEDPREPGLPDQFHEFQPQLLQETFRSAVYPPEQVFFGADLNLYYDVRHPLWYKRPDWFVVLGVAPALTQEELRLSYVIWQEGVAPYLVLELLLPGTEAEDLGQTLRTVDQPPTKWQVYEQILRIPFYAVYDRYENQLRLFQLQGLRYQPLKASPMAAQRFWFEEIDLGLGIWEGEYRGTQGRWLRWYNVSGQWLPTPTQRADQEAQRADQEAQRADKLAARLRELGIDPDAIADA